MLSVVKISRCDLDKEQNRKDHVDHREDHIVDHLLDLALRRVPCAFYGAGDIPRRKDRHGSRRHENRQRDAAPHNAERALGDTDAVRLLESDEKIGFFNYAERIDFQKVISS